MTIKEGNKQVILSDFQEDFNYLNLFPTSLTIEELLKCMGIKGFYFKVTVKNN